MVTEKNKNIEEQIGQWRTYMRNRQAVYDLDADELESHLRDQMDDLQSNGLEADEAFLISVKRLGNQDALSYEFAKEHSDRLWKQLVITPEKNGKSNANSYLEIFIVFGLAVAAGLASKIPGLFGFHFAGEETGFYLRNCSLFVLPFLTIYFFWKRQLTANHLKWLVPPFVMALLFANVYPFLPGSHTGLLMALHLPIALWLVIGVAYAGGQWHSDNRRMDFVRFTGELFIYYTLIALGGAVLTGITIRIFSFIGLDAEWFAKSWIIPCGVFGAVIVGSWLVEAKKSVIENMAPVLTRIFTPLFTIMLLAFLASMIWTGKEIQVEREVLIAFDLLLVVVLGLLLYAASARDSKTQPNLFDVTQLVLLVSALIIDALALFAIIRRISEFGFSPNRMAALGMNLILLVNLSWSAWLYFRFIRSQDSYISMERWQTDYLPVYAIWAWIVAVLFPPLFGFL